MLVLGNPRRSVQRWRVDVAVENLRPGDGLGMSGRGEAPAMAADAASRRGVDAARIVIEDAATTTWQNVQFSANIANYTAGVDVCRVTVQPPAPAAAWPPVTLAPVDADAGPSN